MSSSDYRKPQFDGKKGKVPFGQLPIGVVQRQPWLPVLLVRLHSQSNLLSKRISGQLISELVHRRQRS